MARDWFRWIREWFWSHMAWEGFKFLLPISAGGMFLALVHVGVNWVHGHLSVVQLIAALVGSVVVVVLIVGREKARQVVPRLKLIDAHSEGLYDIEPNAIGFTVPVVNDESRFQTTAHNVRASLIFRHSLGDKVKIYPALWVVNDTGSGGGRRLTDCVSIGMGECRSLLILFFHNSKVPVSFLTTAKAPLKYDDASHLVLGKWALDIILEGDNVKHVSKNELALQPHSMVMKQL